MSRLILPGMIALALAIFPVAPQAQQSPAYSLEQLKILIQGGLPAASILRRTAQDCLAFRMDEEVTRQLRAVGATNQLIDGLRSTCVRLPQAAQPAVQPPARVDSARAPVRTDSTRAQTRTDTARAPVRDTARAAVRTDSVRRAAPPPAQVTPTEAADRQLFSPGGAAVKSLILPGLGQFSTRRPVLGAVFMAGGAGALAFGLMSKRTEIDCLARTTDGTCPSNQVRDEVSERPMLIPGLAAFVAVGVVSALEAAAGARRANAREPEWTPTETSAAHLELKPALVDGGGGGANVSLIRLRF